MSKYVSSVILLTILGIKSFNPEQGGSSEQGISSAVTADTTIDLKIRQVCCENGECKTIVNGVTCNGTFHIILEKSNIDVSRATFRKDMKPGEREILITQVDEDGNPSTKSTNYMRLLRSIEAMFASQFGATTLLFEPNDCTSIKETKQSEEKQENKAEPIDSDTHNQADIDTSIKETKPPQERHPLKDEEFNPVSTPVNVKPKINVRAMPTSAEELDTPQEISVKQKEVLFNADYSNITLKKSLGAEQFYLPVYETSETHHEVKPIWFSKSEIKTIRLEVLYKANYYRRLYGMKELRPDDNINNYAQDWANQLAEKANHFSLNNTVEHRKHSSELDNNYGENLFTSLPIKRVGEVAVDMCFLEVSSLGPQDQDSGYDMFKNNKIQRLNQLLWRVTETIGVGAAKGKDGKYYVVMNFNPRGNVLYFMTDNVPNYKKAQIDEARNKLDSINENSRKLIELLEEGHGVRSLPGWQTMLYDKKITT